MIGMVQCGREVTPNLNRLVKEGVRFTRAYDTCPLCVPARTALATGKYPTANGVVYNDWKGVTAGSYEPFHKTLKNAGYYVGHAGVDHIRVNPRLRQQGLDFFVNQEDYEEWAAEKGVKTVRDPSELVEVEEEICGEYEKKRYSGLKVSQWNYPISQFKDFYFRDKSLEFLRSVPEEKPFLLCTYLWAPHPPFRVPKTYLDMYDPDKVVLPDNVGITAKGEPALRRKGVPAQLAKEVPMETWRKVWAAHLALTTMADEIFGQLVQELKDQGKYENTCILFTSDHGDHLGQHSMYQKMEMYEEAVKVPFVIKVPGEQPGCVNEVISHLDVRPTLCQLAQVNGVNGADAAGTASAADAANAAGLPDGDGISLIPAIREKKGDEDRIVYSQYSGNPGYGTIRRMAVSKRYKYVFDGQYEHELYDLEKDPHEMENVAGNEEYKEVLDQMYGACRKWHEEKNDYFKWKKTEESV